MKLTTLEIAKIVAGELFGKPDSIITGVAPIETATSSDITFLSHPKYEKFIEKTSAGCIIVNKKYDLPDKNFIIVQDPLDAIISILEIISQEKKVSKPQIHPTAIISPSASLGVNISVGAYTVISAGAKIDDNTVISSNCFLGRNVTVGKHCFIHPNVVIYDDCILADRVIIHSGTIIGSDGFGYTRKPDGTNKKIPQVGIVKIGNDVEIGSNSSIDRATMGITLIGDGTKIDNLVQIGHNVKIGKNCIICALTGIAGSVTIGDNVTIAAQVGIADHIKIGDNAVIGGRAGVIGNIKSGEIVSGYPARPHAKAMRLLALIEKLPEIYQKFKNQK